MTKRERNTPEKYKTVTLAPVRLIAAGQALNSYIASIDYTVSRKLINKLHLSVRGF